MNTKARLAPREYEITGLMASGMIKKEIANHLGISERTVENTARNVYVKTSVRNVAELTGWFYCTKYNLQPLRNPILSLLFLFLVGVNEISGRDDVRTVRTCKVRTHRSKRKKD